MEENNNFIKFIIRINKLFSKYSSIDMNDRLTNLWDIYMNKPYLFIDNNLLEYTYQQTHINAYYQNKKIYKEILKIEKIKEKVIHIKLNQNPKASKILANFLRENYIPVSVYMKNITSDCQFDGIPKLSLGTAFTMAFHWSYTKEGYDYWKNIHLRWVRYLLNNMLDINNDFSKTYQLKKNIKNIYNKMLKKIFNFIKK